MDQDVYKLLSKTISETRAHGDVKAKTIRDAKKTRSFASITPFVTALKWVRKLNDATVSTKISGAQTRKKLRTKSTPLMVKRKQTVAAAIKAIT